jgi:ribonuclease-3
MRPRFRSESSPSATGENRPLELVRVRRSQRDPGNERGAVKRRSRRGGRRRRGNRPPPPRPGFWAWLLGLLGASQRPAPVRTPAERAAAFSDQESRAVAEFERHFKITFRRKELLRLALTHRSFLSVTGKSAHESNERLEFLGDSVLGLVTSEHLFLQFPEEPEGHLTKTKSLLVSKAILSRRALAMGLGRFVLMSHSEMESGGRQRLSILADAFEAVLGAIYLDQGFDVARDFIKRHLLRDSDEILADKRHTNYKSHLQEYVQSTFRTHPVYRIRSQIGPDHSKQFHVEVLVGRRSLGTGDGRNKKEAEQAAARDALEKVEGVRNESRARGREREEATRGRREESRREELRREEPRRESRREESRRDEPRREESRREESRGEEPRREAPRRREERPMRTEVTARREEPVRPAPVAPEPVRVVEIEPPPSRREYDDYDEVGRPEGPREDLHVDPFAVDPEIEQAERGTGDTGVMRGRSVIGPGRRYQPVETMAPEPEAPRQPSAFGTDDDEEEVRETPESPSPAPPSRPASDAFGRRSRRGR